MLKKPLFLLAMAFAVSASAANGLSLKKPGKAKAPSKTSIFFESFENCGGASYSAPANDALPEGWTRVNTFASELPEEHWHVYSWPRYYAPAVPDGRLYMALMGDLGYKDEQIITPLIEIPSEYFEVQFWWWTSIPYMFKLDEEHFAFDGNGDGYFLSQEINNNLEVLVQEEGSTEWTKIGGMAELYMGKSYQELYDQYQEDYLLPASVSLADFGGKKVRIAFRMVGYGSNLYCLDAITIDFKPLDASYEPPLYRQYLGLSLDGYWKYQDQTIEVYPANTPITWFNDSRNAEGTNYEWLYDDPETKRQVTADASEPLTLIYKPDYAKPDHNFYAKPKLRATAENRLETTYTSNTDSIMIGGRFTAMEEDENEELVSVRYGLLPFDVRNEGCDIYVKPAIDFGRNHIPIFGYSEDSDDWWRDYIFQGDPGEEDKAYCIGFSNYVIPAAPLVLDGVSVAAIVNMDETAKLYLKIYGQGEEGMLGEEPIAVSEFDHKDMVSWVHILSNRDASLYFRFDKPVVLDPDEYPGGFLVEVSGFHDGGVKFFAPMMAEKPNAEEWTLSFYRIAYCPNGKFDDRVDCCAWFQNDNGDLYGAFAITLDGFYPWMVCDHDDTIVLNANGMGQISFASNYEGKAFSVDAADDCDWLMGQVKGQYQNCRLQLATLDEEPCYVERTTQVTVSAPGLWRCFTVVAPAADAIEGVNAETAAATRYYNLQGQRVQQPTKGIFIQNGRKVLK